MRIRAFSVASVCALALAACDGGDDGGTVDIKTLFPADNEIAGWAEEVAGAMKPAGIEYSESKLEVENNMIDGDAVPFFKHDWRGFARQHYTNGTGHIELRIWSFASASESAAVFAGIKDDAHYAASWTELAIGAGGLVADRTTYWNFLGHKDAYFAEARVSPKDEASRSAGQTFMTAVLGKIP